MMKRILSSVVLLFAGLATANAQEATASQSVEPMTLFYITVGFMFLVLVVVLAVAANMLKVLNALISQSEVERAEKEGVPYMPRPSFWQNLWDKSNDFVDLDKEETITRDHSYDGIKELDNHLPPWWTGLLYLTVIFGFVYMVLYHVTDTLPLQDEEFAEEVASYDAMVKAAAMSSGEAVVIEEGKLEVSTDAAVLSDGKKTYMSICASCHRPDGGGDIGPNLTDEYWKSGGSINDIYSVIKTGVPNTNMISWEGQFSPEKMVNVANYIYSLKGTTPANPKAPEGDLFVPEVKQETDTLQTAGI